LDVHVYHHVSFDPEDKAALARIEQQLARILQQQGVEMSISKQQWETIKQNVAQETSVRQSVITLMGQMKAQLDSLAQQDSIDPADVQAVSDQIAANQTALADAVAQNTPAASEPPAAGGTGTQGT
jgi:hypothetical protein